MTRTVWRAIAFLGLGLLPLTASAGIFERTSDLHTAVPEFLIHDQNWGARLGFGLTENSGNHDQVAANADLALFKKWDDYSGYLTGRYVYLGVGANPITQLQNLGASTLRFDRTIDAGMRWFVFTTQAYNEAQGIRYRGSYGTGPWFQLSSGPVYNAFSIAAVYERELHSSGGGLSIGRSSFREVVSVPLAPTSHIDFDFFIVPAMDDISDFRLMASPSLEAGIAGQLSMKFYIVFERNSRPPAGILNNDTEIGTSFTLRFGE